MSKKDIIATVLDPHTAAGNMGNLGLAFEAAAKKLASESGVKK